MEIVFAGFGGQGVLTTGLIVAYIAMKDGQEVLWSPAYGAEMRGGKAYSLVKFSGEPIEEPVITELDALVAMNQPALDFCAQLKPGGLLLVNSDAVDDTVPVPTGFRTVRLPVNTLAQQAGAPKGANIVSVGALTALLGLFDPEEAEATLCEFFENKGKGKFNDSNRAAFRAGLAFAAGLGQAEEKG